MVKAIEEKREKEKAEKQQRDIKPATVEDYFKGFSSTISKKVNNPKQIRSVVEEEISRSKTMTEAEEKAEIQRRFATGDDYMECFPMEYASTTAIKGFDEKDFGAKVKEMYYDEDVIKKDEEWAKAESKLNQQSSNLIFMGVVFS